MEEHPCMVYIPPSKPAGCRRRRSGGLSLFTAAIRAGLVLGWCCSAAGLGLEDVGKATRLRGHHHHHARPDAAPAAAPAPGNSNHSTTRIGPPVPPNARPPKAGAPKDTNTTATTRPAAVPGAGRPPKGDGRTQTPPVPPRKVGRISLPNSDVTLSRIAYGTLHFPEFKDNITGLVAAIETCLDLGITTLDLADVYGWYQDGHGMSNDLLSQVFAARPDLRARMELVCKFGIRLNGGYHVDSSAEWIHESIDRYLTLFNTDHVDVFMFHNPDPNMDNAAAARAFREIKESGKAKALGISNFHQWEYEKFKVALDAEGVKLSVHEMETSVLHPDKITDGTVEYYSQGDNELRVLGWGALGGDPYGGKNLLFGSDGERERRIVSKLTETGLSLGKGVHLADEVAVAWLLNNKDAIVPIIGTTTVARIRNQTVPAELIPFSADHFNDILATLHYDDGSLHQPW